MASNVTRDHHRWTRDITAKSALSINLEDTTSASLTIDSDAANAPRLILRGVSQGTNASPSLRFITQRDSDTAGQDDDYVGYITFQGYNDAATPTAQTYVSILATIDDATDGEESGKLSLQIASHDGELEDGLVLTGGSVDTEVDVTIGNGVASMTTIAGDLDIDGDTITSVGALEIDPGGQLSITGQHMSVDSNNKVIFGDAGEHIVGDGTDLDIISSNDLTLTTDGDITLFSAGYIHLRSAAVFTIKRPIYGNVLYTADTGNNTDVDFRSSNKSKLTLTGGATVAELGFVFPDNTGNFLLKVAQDGSGSGVISAYKVYTFEGDDAGTHDIAWAGGSVPTLTTTATKADIISIFWDNHLEKAYGTITHNF